MNILAKSFTNLARICLTRTVQASVSTDSRTIYTCSNIAQGSLLATVSQYLQTPLQGIRKIYTVTDPCAVARRLYKMHMGIVRKRRKKKKPLDGKPFAKGVVLKTLVKKPKKPNSANRKCVLVRLSTGKEMVAYIPGIGHNLQEHNIVLCRVGRCKDVPGVKIKCVRGVYDLPHVIKSTK